MSGERLELESRRRIFGAVQHTPGVHFRALVDDLSYAEGTLQYHLHWLADAGLVDVSRDGQYTRYYPADSFDEGDRQTMNALRRRNARRVLAHLAADGPLTTTGLAERLEKAASTVSWHLSKLHDAGLVEKARDGRSVAYSLADPDRVRYLYVLHRESFADRLVDRLLDIWEGY